MRGENVIEEPMDVDVMPSTSGYNIKNKEKEGKTVHLPWYVRVRRNAHLYK